MRNASDTSGKVYQVKFHGHSSQMLLIGMSNFLFISMTMTKAIQRIQVSTLLRGKICAGTILPSFEHNWLK